MNDFLWSRQSSCSSNSLSDSIDIYECAGGTYRAFNISDTSVLSRKMNESNFLGDYKYLNNNYGIYFLYKNEYTDRGVTTHIYVGESKNRRETGAIQRIVEHYNLDARRGESYAYKWNKALYITNIELNQRKDFTSGSVDALENFFIELFKSLEELTVGRWHKIKCYNKVAGHETNEHENLIHKHANLIVALLSDSSIGILRDNSEIDKAFTDIHYRVELDTESRFEEFRNKCKAEYKDKLNEKLRGLSEYSKQAYLEKEIRENFTDYYKTYVEASKNMAINIGGRLYDMSKYTVGKTHNVVTSVNTVNNMLDMLDESLFDGKHSFLCMYSKDGVFPVEIIDRVVKNASDDCKLDVLRDFIKNKLFILTDGSINFIATVQKCLEDYVSRLNDLDAMWSADINNYIAFNVLSIRDFNKIKDKGAKWHRNFTETLKKEFGTMRFDVVLGNPPYNGGIYLDFVMLGHAISDKCSLWITPAKWQSQGEDKNEQFRKLLVPYMSKLVYYPDCLDIFAIAESCGICYYIIDKDKHDKCEVTNISSMRPDLNSIQEREITCKQSLWNAGNSIVEHIGKVNHFKIEDVQERKKYTVSINTQSSIMRGYAIKEQDSNGKWRIRQDLVGKGGAVFDKDGKAVVLGKISVLAENEENVSGTSKCIFTSDNKAEVKSFLSYIQSKLVSFLVFIGISGLTIMNDESWRFVPDPGNFDHIFTDAELYKKYNLTADEINIIESVIKECKN